MLADAEEKFKEIRAAYDLLSDPVKKIDYDNSKREEEARAKAARELHQQQTSATYAGFTQPRATDPSRNSKKTFFFTQPDGTRFTFRMFTTESKSNPQEEKQKPKTKVKNVQTKSKTRRQSTPEVERPHSACEFDPVQAVGCLSLSKDKMDFTATRCSPPRAMQVQVLRSSRQARKCDSLGIIYLSSSKMPKF